MVISMSSSYDVQLRKQNGLSHPLLYVDHTVNEGDRNIIVYVLGTTRNVYQVKFKSCSKPSCDCPDFKKRRLQCKHIYFVLLRILQVEDWSSIWNLNYALDLINNRLGSLATLRVSQRQRETFASLKNREEGAVTTPDVVSAPRNTECGFCLDDISSSSGALSDTCGQCGNGWHKACWNRWAEVTRKATCIICRAVIRKIPSETQNEYIQL